MAFSSPRKSKAGTRKKTKRRVVKKSTAKKETTEAAAPKKRIAKKGRIPKAKKEEKLTPIQRWRTKMGKSSKFKDCQVQMASEVKNPYGLRRPTGKLALDIALGGGYHAGGVIEIQGAQSVGKTREYWETIGELQEIYGAEMNVLIAATELRPDKDQARLSGCCIAYSEQEIVALEMARVMRGLPRFTEEELADLRLQVGEIEVAMAPTAEKLFDILLDAIEENIFQLVVIDSLGALLPKAKDDTDTLSEKTYGGASVPVTDFMNKLYPILNMDRADGEMQKTTILAINQARARIGGSKWERPTKEAMGAYAWKHGQLVSVLLTRGAKVRESRDGPVCGFTVNWEIIKGKAGTHDGKKGSYDFHYYTKLSPVFWSDVRENWHGGVPRYNEHAETAKSLGVIEGTTWLSYERVNGEIVKAQGMDNFAQLLAEDSELCEEIKNECLKRSNIFVSTDG